MSPHFHPMRRVLLIPGSHITRIARLEQSPFANPMSPAQRRAAAHLHTSREGTRPFNGDAVRLDVVETDAEGGLAVTLSRVEFFDFLSTNCNPPACESQQARRAWDRTMTYGEVLANRDLANIIAVSLIIEDSEGSIGIAKRSGRVHVSSGAYSATVTGTLDDTDFREADPFAHCVKRETAEELNLRVLQPQFKGVVISWQKLQPVFMYSTVLDVPWRELVGHTAEATDVSRENDALLAVPLGQCSDFVMQHDMTDVAAYQLWAYASERGSKTMEFKPELSDSSSR